MVKKAVGVADCLSAFSRTRLPLSGTGRSDSVMLLFRCGSYGEPRTEMLPSCDPVPSFNNDSTART